MYMAIVHLYTVLICFGIDSWPSIASNFKYTVPSENIHHPFDYFSSVVSFRIKTEFLSAVFE